MYDFFDQLSLSDKPVISRLLRELNELKESLFLNQIVDTLPAHYAVEAEVGKTGDETLARYCGLIVTCFEQYLELHRLGGEKDRWHGELMPALEEIIVSLITNAISHASCKSGKDRRGMLLILEDSLLIFYHLFQKIVVTNDS